MNIYYEWTILRNIKFPGHGINSTIKYEKDKDFNYKYLGTLDDLPEYDL